MTEGGFLVFMGILLLLVVIVVVIAVVSSVAGAAAAIVDDEDSEDEDVNAWDTEPQYPLDEIDSLEISGSTFVLTGDFQNCDGDRNQVKEMIEAKGGRCTGAVSGKTNYLVLGDFGSAGSKKIDQVMGQRAKGKDIKIIAEYDLFRFL